MGKCGYYDERNGICNNSENPKKGTSTGVSREKCGSKSEDCNLLKFRTQ